MIVSRSCSLPTVDKAVTRIFWVGVDSSPFRPFPFFLLAFFSYPFFPRLQVTH